MDIATTRPNCPIRHEVEVKGMVDDVLAVKKCSNEVVTWNATQLTC